MPTMIRFLQEFANEFEYVGYSHISRMSRADVRLAVAMVAEDASVAFAMRAFLRTIPQDAETARLLGIIDTACPNLDSASNN